MLRVELEFERWEEFWSSGGEALIQAEHDEYSSLISLGPLAPHHEVFRNMSLTGRLHVLVARLRGVPVGYFMLTISSDLESKDTLLAQQGPFFVLAKHAGLGLGGKMICRVIKFARELHAAKLEFHHPVEGRGAKLGSLFLRHGAKPSNSTYLLSLEPL